PGAFVYAYMNLEAKTLERLQGMGLRMLSPGGKPSPALEKAMAQLHSLGRIESIGAVSLENGMRSLTEVIASDPKKYMEASLAMLQAMKGGDGQLNLYKHIKIEPDVQTYRG